MIPESTIGEGGLPPHSQVSWRKSRESRDGVACVGSSPWGLPHPREPVWRPDSQGWLGCFKSGHGCPERHHGCPERHHGCPGSGHGCPGGVELLLGLHQECPRVVKLVMGLHHVSQGGKQGELQDGKAKVWASLCEF